MKEGCLMSRTEFRGSNAKRIAGALLVVSMLALAGCPRPMLSTTGDAAPPVVGAIDFTSERQTQATMGEIAQAATVSLIDPFQGQTVATSITDSNRQFRLTFDSTFKPGNAPYYLEAVKGLQVGGAANRAGAPAARIRTLIQWTDAGWQSVSSGSITVSATTTALSVLASLRSADVSRPALINSLVMDTPDTTELPHTPDTFAPGASGITNVEFHRTYELVSNALSLDQDPLQVIYRAEDGSYQRVTQGSTVLRVSPANAAIGAAVTVVGHGFATPAANNVVTFSGGVTAVPTAVSADRTQLTVTIPAGAGTGPVAVSATTGELSVSGGFLKIANTPLAGTRFVGINSGNIDPSARDLGAFVRIVAMHPNTRVTLNLIRETGSVDRSEKRLLVSAGSAWESNLVADRISMFQILSDKPVLATYDAMAYDATATGYSSDDEWATQTGTDYYFRVPRTHGEFQIISHATNNPVTLTCLTDATLSETQTLTEGGTLSRNGVPSDASSYWFRVQSAHPTTAIFGIFSDNASTQVFSSDMKTFYTAHLAANASAKYQFVGYEDGTSVTVTNLMTGVPETIALNAGQLASRTYGAAGQVKLRAVSNRPVGFYVADGGNYYEMNQHGSADEPGTVGKTYRIVAPGTMATNVYVLSLSEGNAVTLTGGLAGTHSLGEFQWKNVGSLAANTVLTVSAKDPIAVFTTDIYPYESNYTLLPY
jgi:hypothetical protein